ncbi:MAG: hypothetical protein M5R36_14270 [Deltaproteobacteria bacterium]|nr:hypothetical protein [Deltaproteobacteria bacterium]
MTDPAVFRDAERIADIPDPRVAGRTESVAVDAPATARFAVAALDREGHRGRISPMATVGPDFGDDDDDETTDDDQTDDDTVEDAAGGDDDNGAGGGGCGC